MKERGTTIIAGGRSTRILQFATVNSIVEEAAIRVPLIGDWSITAPRGHCGAVT